MISRSPVRSAGFQNLSILFLFSFSSRSFLSLFLSSFDFLFCNAVLFFSFSFLLSLSDFATICFDSCRETEFPGESSPYPYCQKDVSPKTIAPIRRMLPSNRDDLFFNIIQNMVKE